VADVVRPSRFRGSRARAVAASPEFPPPGKRIFHCDGDGLRAKSRFQKGKEKNPAADEETACVRVCPVASPADADGVRTAGRGVGRVPSSAIRRRARARV